MPWREVTVMSSREEFVRLALLPGTNRRELCRRFGISPKTGYKWLERYGAAGRPGLADQSRRPHRSPARTTATLEARVLALRGQYPDWGGRKLRALMLREGCPSVPSASTITAILRRHGQLSLSHPGAAAWQRFEHDAPNQLWQMDFKGHFPLVGRDAVRCHPLTVVDDHSRFNLCLRACANEREEGVRAALSDVFRRYGLPLRITADNGSPWGNNNSETITGFGAWLIRLGVRLGHSRPHHPQSQGKAERFHRTLKAELLLRRSFDSLAAAQRAFDDWRASYNLIRPHEALDLLPPITRYQPSPRPFPETLPPIEYDSADEVRRVQHGGWIFFRGREWRVGRGLVGLPVALRQVDDGCWDVFFCHQRVGQLDLRAVA